jgi:endonuclease/exonuclease/phosphatase family metal-dependent hydrolase
MRIATFNVLSPTWAAPSLYPRSSQKYLSRTYRRGKLITFLKRLSIHCDLIALQETNETEFSHLKASLAKDFSAFQVFHDPKYWSEWNQPGHENERNGVALFIKRSAFQYTTFHDLKLGKKGNHAAFVQAVHLGSRLPIRAASIHLDSDDEEGRHQELSSLLQILRNGPRDKEQTRDYIAGDFNDGMQKGSGYEELIKNKFRSALRVLNQEEWTCPYSEDEYQSPQLGILDHIWTANSQPIDGSVINFGLWKTFPRDKETKIEAKNIEDERITENLKISGSDHFPLWVDVKL